MNHWGPMKPERSQTPEFIYFIKPGGYDGGIAVLPRTPSISYGNTYTLLLNIILQPLTHKYTSI